MPDTHEAPSPHAVPQEPQWLGSLPRSAHAMPQVASFDAQVAAHCPAEQNGASVAQPAPHAPQLVGSLLRLAQVSSHTAAPAPQCGMILRSARPLHEATAPRKQATTSKSPRPKCSTRHIIVVTMVPGSLENGNPESS